MANLIDAQVAEDPQYFGSDNESLNRTRCDDDIAAADVERASARSLFSSVVDVDDFPGFHAILIDD